MEPCGTPVGIISGSDTDLLLQASHGFGFQGRTKTDSRKSVMF